MGGEQAAQSLRTRQLTESKAGITHIFVNLGSDHPSIMEAMAKGKKELGDKFPRIITCPNEVCNDISSDRLQPLNSECRWLPSQWQTASLD